MLDLRGMLADIPEMKGHAPGPTPSVRSFHRTAQPKRLGNLRDLLHAQS